MERSRKLTLTDWTKANDALNLYFTGNKSKLTKHLDMSRTTVTNFFNQQPVREAEFRKICLALRLNWQEVSAVEEIAFKQEDWMEEVRSRCCEKILYQHSTIQLLNQTEIGVDQLYVDVWLLNRSPRTFQVSESTMLKTFDLRNDRLGLGDRIKRNEGMEIANEKARLLILGKPGAGKTTFLKHLAVDCSKGKFQPNLIPVLIELRRIQSTKWRLLNAISEELKLENRQTQKLLERGKLLILMDGLDEVPTTEFRRSVQEQVRGLSQEPQYSDNHFIVTCRTQIIEVIPNGFASVEVADFNPEQVKQFVKNWFRASELSEANIAQQWQAFSDVTSKNPALRELTVTPVLLSLMCLVLQDEGDLPNKAALLYRKGIRLLLEKWNERKEISNWQVGKEIYQQLKLEQKEALLNEIAARKFEKSGNFVLFEQEDLAKQITHLLNLPDVQEGKAVLKAIEAQHGLLVERADELWSFSHLTFQEYFTVRWLTQLQQDEGLARKIVDQRWQEIFKLAIASDQPVDGLLRLVKQAIDCSVSKDPKLQEFLAWVQDKAISVKTNYKLAAIRAFYFALARDLNLIHARALARTLDLFLDRDQDLDFPFDQVHDFAHNLALDYTRDLVLDILLDLTLDLEPEFNRARVRTRINAFLLALNLTIEPTLADRLKELKIKLPERFAENWNSFQRWWETNQQTWTEEVRQVMIEHRNIGHNWQFTKPQKQVLQRYYDANKFLVELLKQPGAVSDTVRQEIEDNLLLPIATLRERLPEMYGGNE